MSIRIHGQRSGHVVVRPSQPAGEWPDPTVLAIVLAGFLVVLGGLIVALVIVGAA